jgi:RNA polymerase primary sigma factor
MNAIDKYDPNKGAKLSYYASFWIKQSIRRAISNKGRTIRIPVGLIESKLKVKNFELEFEREHARLPNVNEISEGTGLKVKKINKIKKISLQSESLNAQVGDEEVEVGDLIVNENSPNPLFSCAKKNESEVLNAFLNTLDKRQKYIIIHRFGLDGAEPHTLEVIGKKFNLTRERIRQLEISALRSLREMYRKINESNKA